MMSEDETRDQIMALLDCLFFERVLLPDFGVEIPVFDPADSSSLGTLIARLQLAIEYWIGSGIQVTPSGFSDSSPEMGAMEIQIQYPGSVGGFTYRIPT